MYIYIQDSYKGTPGLIHRTHTQDSYTGLLNSYRIIQFSLWCKACIVEYEHYFDLESWAIGINDLTTILSIVFCLVDINGLIVHSYHYAEDQKERILYPDGFSKTPSIVTAFLKYLFLFLCDDPCCCDFSPSFKLMRNSKIGCRWPPSTWRVSMSVTSHLHFCCSLVR